MGKNSGTTWVTLLWLFATGHPVRKRKSMRNSPISWKQPHSHRLWCSWGTSALISAAKTAHVGTQEPRRFLHSTDGNVLTQVVEDPSRRGVLLDLALTNKDWLGM